MEHHQGCPGPLEGSKFQIYGLEMEEGEYRTGTNFKETKCKETTVEKMKLEKESLCSLLLILD